MSTGLGSVAEAAKRRAPLRLREAGKRAARRYGVRTAGLRPLPEFLIVGTKRGGTTSMWNYLLEHPLVLPMMPRLEHIKSPHFFYWHHAEGLDWYRSHFPSTAARRAVQLRHGRPPVTGEASPYYLYDPRTPERVRAVLPSTRVIVQLRDPVERAYSHYQERVKQGVEPLSFEAALAAEPVRLAGEWDRMAAEPDYYSRRHDWYSYRDRGVYAPQLARWLAAFPAEQVLVLRSEDIYRDAQDAYDRVVEFLGLPRYRLRDHRPHNRLPAQPMAAATRAELTDFYRPHNEALYRMLGQDLGWQR